MSSRSPVRPLTAVVLFSWVVVGCSAPPAPDYVEGTVAVSPDATVTIDKQPLQEPVTDPDMANRLKRYEGLLIGLEYRGAPGTPSVVSPIEDKLHAFASQTELAPSLKDKAWSHYWTDQAAGAKSFGRVAELTAVMEAASRVDKRYKAIGLAPDAQVGEEIHQLVREMKTFVNAAYAAADVASTPEQRSALIAAGAETQAQLQAGGRLMSYEGGYRRPPRYYRNVAGEAGATVAILRAGNPIGSGFLISREWLVTNRHVVGGIVDFQDSVTIAFDYEEPDGGQQPRCKVVDRKVAKSDSPLDVAALKFTCPGGFPPNFQGRILEFSSREAVIGDAVYVVGHPFGGFKQVADNAFVRFPFTFSNSSREGTRTTIVGGRALQWFDAFYQRCGPDRWCYFTPEVRWGAGGSTANIPTLGFDSNTGPGSSGSPVLFVADNKVAGLYFGGAGDYSTTAPWSFERHEGAIPSSEIVTWLRSEKVIK